MKEIRDTCRKVWNDFNTFDMYMAKISMFLNIIIYVSYRKIIMN